jgi:hypothetical protein
MARGSLQPDIHKCPLARYCGFMNKGKTIGRVAKSGGFVLGCESFRKISAVEGLKMPKSIRGEFSALDRQNASPRKRREVLVGKYGK